MRLGVTEYRACATARHDIRSSALSGSWRSVELLQPDVNVRRSAVERLSTNGTLHLASNESVQLVRVLHWQLFRELIEEAVDDERLRRRLGQSATLQRNDICWTTLRPRPRLEFNEYCSGSLNPY